MVTQPSRHYLPKYFGARNAFGIPIINMRITIPVSADVRLNGDFGIAVKGSITRVIITQTNAP